MALSRLRGIRRLTDQVVRQVSSSAAYASPADECGTSSTYCSGLLGHSSPHTQHHPSARGASWLAGPGSAFRSLHASTSYASSAPGASSEESISVTFVDKEGKDVTVQAAVGTNLLEVAHENEIDLEGACEASLACSTCHLIIENDEFFKKLPEASEDELDMLDLAFGLCDRSRLGCQVIASKDIDGIRVRIPSATRNFYVDGHKPKPH